jgi:tRNA A37 methylthiotransferase MiaB
MSIQLVKKFKTYDAELIVSGCLPTIEKEKLSQIFHGRTIGTKDFDKHPEKMDDLFPQNIVKFKEIPDANISFKNINKDNTKTAIKQFFNNMQWIGTITFTIKDHVIKHLRGEQSFFYFLFSLIHKPVYRIRISWGCNSNCAYCGIKQAIGKHKSKPSKQAIEEFKTGVQKGHHHFALNADDIGAYGTDIGSSFSKLLDKITKIPGEYQISISNLSPRWLVRYIDDLERIIKSGKIVALGIPIQSGSSRILKLMNRYHNTEKILKALQRVKATYPMLLLHTHIMIGFPTESEEEFNQTLAFLKKCTFDGGKAFPYSCKKGSKAEQITPKIPKDEITKRLMYAKDFLTEAGYSVYKPKEFGFIFEKIDTSDKY